MLARKLLYSVSNGKRTGHETGLRRNYFGGETQMYWVESHPGVKVKGFGYVTFRELDEAGLLRQDYDVNYGTICHRRYYAAE